MGKLLNNLKQQLKDSDYKKDAEDCIKLYNWIRENYEGEVWESDWTAIAKAKWIGKYPNFKLIHTPTLIGYTLLKAIENKN